MSASWDTANYHYFIGWAASCLSSYKYGALAQYHTFLNPVIDIVNYILFSTSSYLGAAFHSVFFTISLYVLYKIGLMTLGNDKYNYFLSLIGCIIGLTGAMSVSLFGSFQNDHINSVFIFLSLIIALKSFEKNISDYLMLLSGVSSGLAVAFKLTAVMYALAIFFSVLLLSEKKIKATYFIYGLIIGYFFVEGPFWILRWNEYQNPIFPFANNFFHSPYYPSQWKSFGNFELSSLLFYLTLPVRWLEIGAFSEAQTVRDGRLLLAFIGIIAFLIGGFFTHRDSLKNDKKITFLMVFFLTSWVLWILIFRIYRYLVVLELLSGFLFIFGLLKIRLISQYKRWQNIFLFFLTAIFLLTVTVYPNWGRRMWEKEFFKAIFPFSFKHGQLILFADQRLSYLMPFLVRQGVSTANFYSQPWISGDRKGNPIDPIPATLPNLDDVFIMQYHRENLIVADSQLFSVLSANRIFSCKDVQTNAIWNPVICKYYRPEELADYASSAFDLSDKNWLNGIARSWAGFFVENSSIAKEKYRAGRIVLFVNGSERKITYTQENGSYLNVYLDGAPLDGSLVGAPNKIEIEN